jgi:dCMP deaminase
MMTKKDYKLHQIRLKQALATAEMSSCVSRQVGALITVDSRIVSEGYNGTPKGYPNCSEHFSAYTQEHHEWSNTHEIHAEMNAIGWSARKGIAIEGGIIYSTTRPCLQCTKNIIAFGIKEIYYLEDYPKNDVETLDNFLRENNVNCVKIVIDV